MVTMRVDNLPIGHALETELVLAHKASHVVARVVIQLLDFDATTWADFVPAGTLGFPLLYRLCTTNAVVGWTPTV